MNLDEKHNKRLKFIVEPQNDDRALHIPQMTQHAATPVRGCGAKEKALRGKASVVI